MESDCDNPLESLRGGWVRSAHKRQALMDISLRLAAILLFLIGVAVLAFGADTATFRGNPEHTGVYDGLGISQLGGVKWTFHAGGHVISSAAVQGESVYVGSTSGALFAIDRKTGVQRWKFETHSRIASSPAVVEGGVYFGAYNGVFYALDAQSGALKWKFKTEGERRFAGKHLHGSTPASETMPDPYDCYLSSPVVAAGAVYFGSGDGNVYSLSAITGGLQWKFKTGDVVHASPALADGMLFLGSWDHNFYALDAATGAERWRFKTGEDQDIHNQEGIQSSAAVADGLVFFGCRDAHLYALEEKTGKLQWSYSTKGSWVIASPAVQDGKVYFATSDTGLLLGADAKSGQILFTVDLKAWPIFSSPAIAGNMLYVGSTSGVVHAVDLPTHTLRWSFQTEAAQKNGPALTKPDGKPDYEAVFASDFYDDIVSGYVKLEQVGPILASPVVAGGVIYVGSVDGNLYALD